MKSAPQSARPPRSPALTRLIPLSRLITAVRVLHRYDRVPRLDPIFLLSVSSAFWRTSSAFCSKIEREMEDSDSLVCAPLPRGVLTSSPETAATTARGRSFATVTVGISQPYQVHMTRLPQG